MRISDAPNLAHRAVTRSPQLGDRRAIIGPTAIGTAFPRRNLRNDFSKPYFNAAPSTSPRPGNDLL